MFDRLRVVFFLVKSHSIKLVSRVFIWRHVCEMAAALLHLQKEQSHLFRVWVWRTCVHLDSWRSDLIIWMSRLFVKAPYVNCSQFDDLHWFASYSASAHCILTLSFTLCFAPLNIDLPVIKRLCVKSIALIGSRSIALPTSFSSNSSKVEFEFVMRNINSMCSIIKS